jgi:hypothetical protein
LFERSRERLLVPSLPAQEVLDFARTKQYFVAFFHFIVGFTHPAGVALRLSLLKKISKN